MIVRPAREEDAGGIAVIINGVIRQTTISFKPKELSDAEVAAMIRNAPAFLVAAEGRRIIGYASYDQFRRGAGYARTMEHSIGLLPESRGRGVGRALMTTLESHARAAGIGSLWAGLSGENPEGVAFHRSLGFEEVARLPKVGFKFGRWLDLVLMRKWLDPDGDGADGSD